jgi:hypothetical protein
LQDESLMVLTLNSQSSELIANSERKVKLVGKELLYIPSRRALRAHEPADCNPIKHKFNFQGQENWLSPIGCAVLTHQPKHMGMLFWQPWH